MKMTGGTIYGNHPAVLESGIDFNQPDATINIGKYGEMRSIWLKEKELRKEEDRLVMTGHPNRELAMFNQIVADEMGRIWDQLMAADRANEPREDYWAHVRWMEAHKRTAEEIVANEMIYV